MILDDESLIFPQLSFAEVLLTSAKCGTAASEMQAIPARRRLARATQGPALLVSRKRPPRLPPPRVRGRFRAVSASTAQAQT
jgi:hypothetical protein